MRPERIFAGYMALQALVGVLFWVALGASPPVRSWIELMPERHVVTDAFIFADLVVGITGSLLSAWGLAARKGWVVPVVAFTAGGLVYPTLYLVGWVALAGTGKGALCLGIMLPPATLSTWIAYQTYRGTRTGLFDPPPTLPPGP